MEIVRNINQTLLRSIHFECDCCDSYAWCQIQCESIDEYICLHHLATLKIIQWIIYSFIIHSIRWLLSNKLQLFHLFERRKVQLMRTEYKMWWLCVNIDSNQNRLLLIRENTRFVVIRVPYHIGHKILCEFPGITRFLIFEISLGTCDCY